MVYFAEIRFVLGLLKNMILNIEISLKSFFKNFIKSFNAKKVFLNFIFLGCFIFCFGLLVSTNN